LYCLPTKAAGLETSVACLCTLLVSPRRNHKFHGGVFFLGEQTLGTPLVTAAMRQGCHAAEATDKQTDNQMDGIIA